MRNWVISHLMWNPALDENELTREFLTGYHGKKTVPFLSEYFDVLVNRIVEVMAGGKNIDMVDNTDWLDYETLCRANELFDKAIAAAQQEGGAFVERLYREHMPLDFVWLNKYHKFKRYAEKKGENFCGPKDPVELWKNFFGMCEKYQVSVFAEYTTPKSFEVMKETLFLRLSAKPTPAPKEFKNLNAWVDYQELPSAFSRRQLFKAFFEGLVYTLSHYEPKIFMKDVCNVENFIYICAVIYKCNGYD